MSQNIKPKIPKLKLEDKTADQRQALLFVWITAIESYLTYYDCLNVAVADMVPRILLVDYANQEALDAAHPNGVALVEGGPLVGDFDIYNLAYVAQQELLVKIQDALIIIKSGLGDQALLTYVSIHPDSSMNPYKILTRIKADLHRPTPSQLLLKKREFSSISINSGETAEEFAIRVRNSAYELSMIDRDHPISETEMVMQYCHGIISNSVYQHVLLGATDLMMRQTSVEECARLFTNHCEIAGSKPVGAKVMAVGMKDSSSSGRGSSSSKQNNSSSSSKGSRGRCWICGSHEHFASTHGKGWRDMEMKYKPSGDKKVNSTKSDSGKIRSKKKNSKAKKASKEVVVLKMLKAYESKEDAKKKISAVKSKSPMVSWDSCAEVTAFPQEVDGMTTVEATSKRLLVYGNGQSSKVSKITAMGDLDGIHISKDLTDALISIPALTMKGYKCIFTKKDMYLISPDGSVRFDKKDIVLRARKTGGVYSSKMNDVLQAMMERSEEADPPEIDDPVEPSEPSEEEESKHSSEYEAESTASEEKGKSASSSGLSSIPDRATIAGNIKFKQKEAKQASKMMKKYRADDAASRAAPKARAKKGKTHHDFTPRDVNVYPPRTPWTFGKESSDDPRRHVQSESEDSSESEED